MGSAEPASALDVRFVGANEKAAVDQFCRVCGPDGWATAGLDDVKHYLAAYFQDTSIVAMAGYRPWSDIAGDPCVLTHPEFRGRGYGTDVVSAVVTQALRNGKLLLYQTLETNRGAVHMALKLGYEQYARHVAVRLKRETPSNPPLQRL
jgi:GNAT superfamily N-acetyltransferase